MFVRRYMYSSLTCGTVLCLELPHGCQYASSCGSESKGDGKLSRPFRHSKVRLNIGGEVNCAFNYGSWSSTSVRAALEWTVHPVHCRSIACTSCKSLRQEHTRQRKQNHEKEM